MAPFLGFTCTCSLCPVYMFFRIYTENQPEWHLVAVRQSHNHIRDLARIAFQTAFDASQEVEHRTDRSLIIGQQVRRILPCPPRPVGPNTARLQRADLQPNGATSNARA